mgnify:CR=1 FL=1
MAASPISFQLRGKALSRLHLATGSRDRQKASKEVTALFGAYRDPNLERYVNDVGNRVLATSHLRRPGADEQVRNTPVTFGVLDSPIINAMALPGGYIYVTRGCLPHLNNEDQLATVIGARTRPRRRAARGAPSVSATNRSRAPAWRRGPRSVAGPSCRYSQSRRHGRAAHFLRYSREDELEADKLGVEYALAAGYDAREVITFFRRSTAFKRRRDKGCRAFSLRIPIPATAFSASGS